MSYPYIFHEIFGLNVHWSPAWKNIAFAMLSIFEVEQCSSRQARTIIIGLKASFYIPENFPAMGQFLNPHDPQPTSST